MNGVKELWTGVKKIDGVTSPITSTITYLTLFMAKTPLSLTNLDISLTSKSVTSLTPPPNTPGGSVCGVRDVSSNKSLNCQARDVQIC